MRNGRRSKSTSSSVDSARYVFFGCPEVDGAYAELTARGVVIARPPKVAPYGMKQLYFADPDGFGLCFQWKAE